ncbi:glutathione S-transferase family protein [Pukyongiella litopenaei]|uniref:Glutathione S-transferase family protein n=1 Tax=Pukyongiella litopenaei TaxID=2605946 RepID=A0A2S0MKX4_9RHOB|nr:glutathione S-transferase family protein [Pukyongiella litopenaei]AVO36512.1 glutathione S-transferase family protein [Pukyongiella litopenaei]
MAGGITVYGRATSSNVQAVMWGLAELGLTAERLDYGHVHGGLDTPEFRALNPHGLVPVLCDGDLTVWESCAILRYLAARYGDGGAVWPADPVACAQVDMWAEWAKLSLATAFTGPIFWARVRTAAKGRDEAALLAAVAAFEGELARLDAALTGRDFVAGPAFSLADIVAGHIMYRYYDIDIPRQRLENVARWYDRISARPGFRDHVMVDYAILAHPDAR